MSSAPSRIPWSTGRLLRGLAWGTLLAVLAASGAGLAGVVWHAPGSPARAELTYAGDLALGARLDTAAAELELIAADVEKLADEAKTALEEVASLDQFRIQASLNRGDTLAVLIDARARALRDSLADLPGNEPDAALRYSNPTLARRSAILTAIETSLGLAAHWRSVGLRASETANLVGLISEHDTTVIRAAVDGRKRKWKAARDRVAAALEIMKTIEQLRKRLIAESEDTVLDQWIARTKAYDRALRKLYETLRKSKGKITIEVQSARREERTAFENLPPDRRTILVIIAEVTRGGLTRAVLNIEDAHARLDEALEAVDAFVPEPPGNEPASSEAPAGEVPPTEAPAP